MSKIRSVVNEIIYLPLSFLDSKVFNKFHSLFVYIHVHLHIFDQAEKVGMPKYQRYNLHGHNVFMLSINLLFQCKGPRY